MGGTFRDAISAGIVGREERGGGRRYCGRRGEGRREKVLIVGRGGGGRWNAGGEEGFKRILNRGGIVEGGGGGGGGGGKGGRGDEGGGVSNCRRRGKRGRRGEILREEKEEVLWEEREKWEEREEG